MVCKRNTSRRANSSLTAQPEFDVRNLNLSTLLYSNPGSLLSSIEGD